MTYSTFVKLKYPHAEVSRTQGSFYRVDSLVYHRGTNSFPSVILGLGITKDEAWKCAVIRTVRNMIHKT